MGGAASADPGFFPTLSFSSAIVAWSKLLSGLANLTWITCTREKHIQHFEDIRVDLEGYPGNNNFSHHLKCLVSHRHYRYDMSKCLHKMHIGSQSCFIGPSDANSRQRCDADLWMRTQKMDLHRRLRYSERRCDDDLGGMARPFLLPCS